MTTLMKASNQWMSRPDDQRFTSLDDMLAFSKAQRTASRSLAVSSRRIEARPIDDDPRGLAIMGPDGNPTLPTHWAFNQLAARIKAPAGYLRTLPTDIAADAINHGLAHRDIEDVGALLRSGGVDDDNQIEQFATPMLAALTGPNYGRVWNSDVIGAIQNQFGNGVDGKFTVPGEFGRKLQAVTKDNTTLFASDRDMFIFLADEENRIEVADRRNGQPGSLARGFFVWNSEVGSTTLGVSTFLFDYVCCNRIVWGAHDVQEIKIRHTISAPDKFIEQVGPAMLAYANSSAQGVNDAIAAAQARKISGDQDEVLDFIAKRTRFTRTQAEAINLAHKAEEGRPIETLWDATVGITAYAKGMGHQDARIDAERVGGQILNMAR